MINKFHASRKEMHAMQNTLSGSQRQILVGRISGFVNKYNWLQCTHADSTRVSLSNRRDPVRVGSLYVIDCLTDG